MRAVRAADMIDLGAETQSTPAQSDASAIDFVFDDDEDAGTAVTEEMPAADPFAAAFETKTSEMPTFDTSLDDTAESPTIQTPAADSTLESPTIEEQLGTLEATTTGEIPAFGDNAAPNPRAPAPMPRQKSISMIWVSISTRCRAA